MKYFFSLIRYPNLLMLALSQLIFRYGFLHLHEVPLALNDWQFVLLVIATVCLAAGGYIINDIMDSDTDLINKPDRVVVGKHISEYNAYNYYIGFNVVGVAIGFYLSNVIEHSGFSALFIVIAGTLYLYATNFKQSLLVGNIIVSLLVALSVIIVGIFDLYPMATPENQDYLSIFFEIILDFAFIAFWLNLIREIIKDIEDYPGDLKQGMNTLPIVLGIETTTKVVFGLALIPTAGIIYYVLTYLYTLQGASAYILVGVVGPLIYLLIKIWSAKQKQDFSHLSKVVKIIMLLGLLSILVITLNMKYHA